MIPPVGEDDFKEWLLHPITKLAVTWHKRLIEEAKDNWVSRDFVRQSIEETVLVNAEALGKVQGLATLVTLAEAEHGFETMMGDLQEERKYD